MNANDPAFPQSLAVGPSDDLYRSDDHPKSAGISLRAYFAAKALAPVIAVHAKMSMIGDHETDHSPKAVAVQCAMYADTLIAELNKEAKT